MQKWSHYPDSRLRAIRRLMKKENNYLSPLSFDSNQHNLFANFGLEMQGDPFYKLKNKTKNPEHEWFLASYNVESAALKLATRNKCVIGITDGSINLFFLKPALCESCFKVSML